MRRLWTGEVVDHRGRHYTVQSARIYDLPATPPPVLVAGFGPKAVKLAARIGEGFVTTSPDRDAIELYRSEGGTGPVQAGAKVCFGPDEGAARRTAHRLWPNNGLPGELSQVLPTVAHFEQASQLVPEEAMDTMPLGPDLDRHFEGLKEFADAGVDELYVQQIGPDQDAFFDTWAQEILPRYHEG
jgi:G6PDH family F420-dependent oxidoreductase